MNSANSNPLRRNAVWRPLPVEWLECPEALPLDFPMRNSPPAQYTTGRVRLCPSPVAALRRVDRTLIRLPIYGSTESRPTVTPRHLARRSRFSERGSSSRHSRFGDGGFTVLELMIVLGIIGMMTALALPHLRGFTSGSAMTTATRQLLDDVALARQRALANRSQVCMVFLPPVFWTNESAWLPPNGIPYANAQITNLASHQYAAYAVISLRTVGDQPGRSNVQYLTDWKYLPKGTYIAPFQFTMTNVGAPGLNTNLVSTTNTTTGQSNGFYVLSFPTDIPFPFPSTAATYNNGTSYNYDNLPYICFTPGGQLKSGSDQFIMLTSGSVFYTLDPNGLPQVNFSSPSAPNVAETPTGNSTNNANLIHIDWLTGRAKLERNQF